MDCFDYMTQPQRDDAKRGTGYVADDDRALPRRKHRQRDVWQTTPTKAKEPKGIPVADIMRIMGLDATQSKVSGESLQEAVLRQSGSDTEAKVNALEGRPR